MGRPRQAPSAAAQVPTRAGSAAAHLSHPAGQKTESTQAASDLSLLLRSRTFCLDGESAALSRVANNLQTIGGEIDEGAAAWLGHGPPPTERPAIGLGEHTATLGPHSFGFLNNLDGIAPLAAPLGERPRRGAVAWVVPRREALPEVVPLLAGRGLSASWLISVGDGDPAEVVRFLARDPATRAVLLALGRGVRAQTLLPFLAEKPAVLLDLPTTPVRDRALLRAVARRCRAVVTSDLEEWLAHAALFDAAAITEPRPSGPSRRPRAAMVVVGGGSDFVSAEVQKARSSPPILLRSVELSDDAQATGQALRSSLEQVLREVPTALLCGPPALLAEHEPALMGLGSLVRVDPSQPERLRALLRALGGSPLGRSTGEDKPLAVRTEGERVQGVLATLPPPLYVGGAMVRDEVLGDHDLKRLLAAYGVRVTRQAPANTGTAVLRIASKLSFPIELLASVPPQSDVTELAAAEAAARTVCKTQAELRRQATLYLANSPHVLLREVLEPRPLLRVAVANERGLGAVLRIGKEDAILLPVGRAEAQALAEEVCAAQGANCAAELAQLWAKLAACVGEHTLTLDLSVSLSDEPVVVHAAGVLQRSRPAKA